MGKRLNVIQKFQNFTGKLNEDQSRQLWDVLTALRGNDEVHFGEKENTIAVRMVVWNRLRQEFIKNMWQEPSNDHYRKHILCAVCTLEVLGYKLPITVKHNNVVLREGGETQ